jgi:hypothetical protein
MPDSTIPECSPSHLWHLIINRGGYLAFFYCGTCGNRGGYGPARQLTTLWDLLHLTDNPN